MLKAETMLLRCRTLGQGGARRLLDAAKHNLREIGGAHIDPARGRLNLVLAGPNTASLVSTLAAERISRAVDAGGPTVARKVSRKNGTRAAEIIFGLPASTAVDVIAYFTACLRWVEATFGDVVLSAVIHLDESAPHLHILMLPVRAGEWLGSDVFGKRADIQKLQTEFGRAVGTPFCVRQAPKRLSGSDKLAAARSVVEHLHATDAPVLHCETWPVIRDLIREDPRRFAEQLGVEVRVRLRTLAQLKVSTGRGGPT